MPSSPLDGLCDAIRALPRVKTQQAFAELCQTNIISLSDAMECARALTALRLMVDKRDAWQKRSPSPRRAKRHEPVTFADPETKGRRAYH